MFAFATLKRGANNRCAYGAECSGSVLKLPLACNAGVETSQDFFVWNHLDRAGVDLVEAALDLIAPGGFDLGGGDAVVFVQEAFHQPGSLVWRQEAGLFEESLGVGTYGWIVARFVFGG